jgi:hypothetical protein
LYDSRWDSTRWRPTTDAASAATGKSQEEKVDRLAILGEVDTEVETVGALRTLAGTAKGDRRRGDGRGGGSIGPAAFDAGRFGAKGRESVLRDLGLNVVGGGNSGSCRSLSAAAIGKSSRMVSTDWGDSRAGDSLVVTLVSVWVRRMGRRPCRERAGGPVLSWSAELSETELWLSDPRAKRRSPPVLPPADEVSKASSSLSTACSSRLTVARCGLRIIFVGDRRDDSMAASMADLPDPPVSSGSGERTLPEASFGEGGRRLRSVGVAERERRCSRTKPT